MASTRSKTDDSTFGQPSPLPTSILPSRGDLFKCIKLLRIHFKQSGIHQENGKYSISF